MNGLVREARGANENHCSFWETVHGRGDSNLWEREPRLLAETPSRQPSWQLMEGRRPLEVKASDILH